jgi:hypothetical protein
LPGDVKAALVGGYAAILHGLERTILDVDLCLYSGISSNRAPDACPLPVGAGALFFRKASDNKYRVGLKAIVEKYMNQARGY